MGVRDHAQFVNEDKHGFLRICVVYRENRVASARLLVGTALMRRRNKKAPAEAGALPTLH
jgi:hypothetical protein